MYSEVTGLAAKLALFDVNFLAVIVAALVNMALGFAWYSRALFADAWMKAIGKTREQLGQPGPGYLLALVGAFVTAWALATFIAYADARSVATGAVIGLIAGVGFVLTSFGASYLFEGRPFRLYAINAGYQVVGLLIMGAILGAWR